MFRLPDSFFEILTFKCVVEPYKVLVVHLESWPGSRPPFSCSSFSSKPFTGARTSGCTTGTCNPILCLCLFGFNFLPTSDDKYLVNKAIPAIKFGYRCVCACAIVQAPVARVWFQKPCKPKHIAENCVTDLTGLTGKARWYLTVDTITLDHFNWKTLTWNFL